MLAILVAAASPLSTLETTRLLIKDDQGRIRGEWSADSESSRLTFLDDSGSARMKLESDSAGASLLLYDDSNRMRVAVSSHSASQGFGVYDANRVARVGLGTNSAGPALGLFDANGRLSASVVPLQVTPVEAIESSLTLDLGEFQSVMSEGKGKTYLLRARILLATDKDREDAGNVKRELIERKSELRDAINVVMLGISPADFTGDAESRKKSYVNLRESIKSEINALVTHKIDGVYIEEFVFQ